MNDEHLYKPAIDKRYANMRVTVRDVTKDKRMHVWTAVQNCEGFDCPLCGQCGYTPDDSSRCKLLVAYLRNVEEMLVSSFGAYLNEDGMFRVGMHLLPLYKQLARLKMTEMTVSHGDVSNGRTIHPVFAAIRSCVSAIDNAWKALGLNNLMPPEKPEILSARGNRFDDAPYYDRMERDALLEQKEHAKKLVKRSSLSEDNDDV